MPIQAPSRPPPRPTRAPVTPSGPCGGYPSWPAFDAAALEAMSDPCPRQLAIVCGCILATCRGAGRRVPDAVAAERSYRLGLLLPSERAAHDALWASFGG